MIFVNRSKRLHKVVIRLTPRRERRRSSTINNTALRVMALSATLNKE
jgi:hypothetical protein